MAIPDLGDDLLGVVLRTTLVYAGMVVLLRWAGKREIGQLSITDLALIMLAANAVQNAMVGTNTSVVGGLAAALVLVVLNGALDRLLDRFPRFQRVLIGEPRMLVHDGVALPEQMRREGITVDELLAQVRGHGLERVDQVKLAVLETNGSISIIPKDPGQATGTPPGQSAAGA